mgnify:CR=1 FL=1|jgi:hypothetical protein
MGVLNKTKERHMEKNVKIQIEIDTENEQDLETINELLELIRSLAEDG